MAVRYVDARRRRPPRAELLVNVQLSNHDDTACWAILPDGLAARPGPPSARVWSIAAWPLDPSRRAFLLHATADNGWYAVFLPPGATISLERMSFEWWGDLPDSVAVDAELVRDLTVDGDDISARLGLRPDAATGAVVEASALLDPATVVAAVTGTPAEPLHVDWSSVRHLVASTGLSASEE
jgi:hypothetical protein